MGPVSSVDVATRQGLDGPGIKLWWGLRFSSPDQTWSLPSLPYDGYRAFARGKAAEAWRRPPSPI